MKLDQVKAALLANEATLKRMGVRTISVFGSVARGEDGHDVDLLADFDQALSLVDVVNIEHTLESMLGTDVDLVQDGTLKERMRKRVQQKLVRAF